MPTCEYCGQVVMDGNCDCPMAKEQRKKNQQITDALKRVDELFGAGCEEAGFLPVSDDRVLSLLREIITVVGLELVPVASVQLDYESKVKIGMTGKGAIYIERTDKKSQRLEA